MRQEDLLREWRRAQRIGFLGPRPVEEHLEHATHFRDAVASPHRVLDLGSGGGVPGLALALWWPEPDFVLLDVSRKRSVFLDDAVQALGLAGRVEVVCAAAEDAGRDPRWREGFDLVVARAFGPPAAVAECGTPFLAEGGLLVVSDPPERAPDRIRWPAEPLRHLGLAVRSLGPPVSVLARTGALPDDVPRRSGVPARRPLW